MPQANKYAAMCSRGCRTRVPAGEGYLLWDDGHYEVVCTECWEDEHEIEDARADEDIFAAVGASPRPLPPPLPLLSPSPQYTYTQQRADTLEARVQVLQDKLRAAERDNACLKTKVEQLQEELVRELSVTAALRKQLDSRIAERDAARAQVNTVERERNEARAQAAKAEADLRERERWLAPAAPVNGEDPDDGTVKRFKLLEID